jgi:hypothetical protein
VFIHALSPGSAAPLARAPGEMSRGRGRVWNTVHIARIVDQLRAAGHQVRDEDLARVSPLAHAHVIPNGSYFQSPRRQPQAAAEPITA